MNCDSAFDMNGCEVRPGDFVRYIGQGYRYDRYGWVLEIVETGNVRWSQDMQRALTVLWTGKDGVRRYPSYKRSRVAAINCVRVAPPCIQPFDLCDPINTIHGDVHPRFPQYAEDIDVPVRIRRSSLLDRATDKLSEGAREFDIWEYNSDDDIDDAEVGDVVWVQGDTKRHRLVVVGQEFSGEALRSEDV